MEQVMCHHMHLFSTSGSCDNHGYNYLINAALPALLLYWSFVSKVNAVFEVIFNNFTKETSRCHNWTCFMNRYCNFHVSLKKNFNRGLRITTIKVIPSLQKQTNLIPVKNWALFWRNSVELSAILLLKCFLTINLKIYFLCP